MVLGGDCIVNIGDSQRYRKLLFVVVEDAGQWQRLGVPYVLKIKNVNKNSSRLIFNLQYYFLFKNCNQ